MQHPEKPGLHAPVFMFKELMMTVWKQLMRWGMPLLAGLACVLLMGLLFGMDLMKPRGGLANVVTLGLKSPAGIQFGVKLVLQELLPLHLLLGLLAWLAFFLPAALSLGRNWRQDWLASQGFWVAASGLAWLHVCLWWLVPTALWVIPVASFPPLALAFPALALLALAPSAWALRKVRISFLRWGVLASSTLTLWTAMALLPLWLGRSTYRPPNTSTHPAKVLMLAIDGLREDVANQVGLQQFHGTHFPNAYSPLPATRLLYHLLWGGDPDYYSVGHVVPSAEEYAGRLPLALLDEAKKKGWKTRFFIDDGGTISLSGRTQDFDAIYMPAGGWENFVNSNLAVHFPLYAAWIDSLRIFPSTNPWADPSSALARTLEAGRGADWVMLHSCLAHQPIFLSRDELKQIPGWWKLPARDFEPRGSWMTLDERDVLKWRPERNPALAYRIRMATLLRYYGAVWNQLDRDLDYRTATRIFFADHGERFFHVTEQIQLQGVHGFGLDPWEMRVPLVIQTPGSPNQGNQAGLTAISLLDVRDGLWNLIQGQTLDPNQLVARPFAPGRYHTIGSEELRHTTKKFRQQSKEKIVAGTFIGRNGYWVMLYDKSAAERSKDVTIAYAEKDLLTVYKPLEGGGAQKSEYRGYQLISEGDVTEDIFQSAKTKVEAEFFRKPWK